MRGRRLARWVLAATMYNTYIMKRTQIYLRHETMMQRLYAIERERWRGQPSRPLIREAIEEYLAKLDEDARFAELRAVLDELARKRLALPDGATYVDALREADASREAEIESRRNSA